jgi:hypothetical protein
MVHVCRVAERTWTEAYSIRTSCLSIRKQSHLQLTQQDITFTDQVLFTKHQRVCLYMSPFIEQAGTYSSCTFVAIGAGVVWVALSSLFSEDDSDPMYCTYVTIDAVLKCPR